MLDFGFANEQEIRAELGKRLQAQRLAQDMTQAELAQRAGMALSTLKQMEKKGQCTLENFVRAVMGLGLVDDLQSLFALKITSIAAMEQAAKAPRQRAPRARKIAESFK